MPPLEKGFLDSASQRHSGDPAWQEEKRSAFLRLPAASVILSQPGPATGIGSTLDFFMHSQDQPHRSPQGCPWQLAGVFSSGRTSASHLHGVLWPGETTTIHWQCSLLRGLSPAPQGPSSKFLGSTDPNLPLCSCTPWWWLLPTVTISVVYQHPLGFLTSPTSVSPSALIQVSWLNYLG